MRIRKLLIVVIAVALISVVFLAGRQVGKMGAPDSPGAPGTTSSYTLDDIYNRLDTGAPGTPTTFTEPTSGPTTGTMHTLDEIMAKAGTACTQCNPPGTLSAGGRWCDNANGTVTDMTTGLVWLQKADLFDLKHWEDCTNNDDTHTRAGVLKAADYAWLSDGSVEGDWRLPTLTELKALATDPEAVLAGSQRAFTGVISGYYWTSTTKVSQPTQAWNVLLWHGTVHQQGKENAWAYVWPVRGP